MSIKVFGAFKWGRAMFTACLLSCSIVNASEYEIEECCTLCPETQIVESYNTKSLNAFKFLEQGLDGWLFRSGNDLINSFGPDDLSAQHLAMFTETLKQQGTSLVLVYLPPRGVMHSERLGKLEKQKYNVDAAKQSYLDALDRFRSVGMIVPDMKVLFQAPVNQDFYFWRDTHWTPSGARATAKVTAEAIKELSSYSEIPKKSYVNLPAGLIRKVGSHQHTARKLCGDTIGYADQYVKGYRSELVDTGLTLSSDDLFGEEALPEVVLVGTSNSNGATNYNFDGFLMEYLQVEITNEAIAGGSFNGAISRYLVSDEFRERPPKVLIWEMPSYHTLNDDMFYRQLKPMAEKGCLDKVVVLQSEVPLKTGRNEVLFNGGGRYKDLVGGNLLVELRFDNPFYQGLDATVWYLNRRKESVSLEFPDRVDMGGVRVFSLNDQPPLRDFMFLSMDVNISNETPVDAMPRQLKATLCLKE